MQARRQILDSLFWETDLLETPNYTNNLPRRMVTSCIFNNSRPVLHNRVVLDAGAGSGGLLYNA